MPSEFVCHCPKQSVLKLPFAFPSRASPGVSKARRRTAELPATAQPPNYDLTEAQPWASAPSPSPAPEPDRKAGHGRWLAAQLWAQTGSGAASGGKEGLAD